MTRKKTATARPHQPNGLRYTGADASHWLPGVPARDLTEQESQAFDVSALIASGLYELAGKPADHTEEETNGQPND